MKIKQLMIVFGMVGVVCGVAACLDESAKIALADEHVNNGGNDALGILYPYTKYTKVIKGREFEEPSGIVFHPKRGTLFVLGDEGMIGEFTLKGKRVKIHQFSDKPDFEGITVDPNTGLLYVAHEIADKILEIESEGFKVLRAFTVPRRFKGELVMAPEGDGIEAITFVPMKAHAQGGVFYISNQAEDKQVVGDGSALLKIELPLRVAGEVKILNYYPQDILDLSGMFYDAVSGHLFVVSDLNNLLLEMDLEAKILKAWALPGETQEGLTIDNEGRLYIAQDSGGVIRLSGKAFPRVKHQDKKK